MYHLLGISVFILTFTTPYAMHVQRYVVKVNSLGGEAILGVHYTLCTLYSVQCTVYGVHPFNYYTVVFILYHYNCYRHYNLVNTNTLVPTT